MSFLWGIMNIGTVIGLAAVLLWGLSALLLMQLKNIPPFEIITMTYLVSSSILLTKVTIQQEWHKIKQPLKIWLLGLIGIYGTTAFYIFAIKLAPPAIVVLISYTWPILTMFFTMINPQDKFHWPFLLSCLLAYLGIFLLVIEDPSNMTPHHEVGYLLAFLSAFCWAGYSYCAPYFKQYSIDAIGIYIFIGMIVSLVLHGMFEVTVIPSLYQAFIILFMGITTAGPAFLLWEYGIKNGDHRLLFISSYATPIISNGLLVLSGETHGTFYLLLATIFVILSAYITTSYRTYES